jgi:hypothetical protein
MGSSGGSSKVQNAERTVDSKGCVHEVSEGKEDSTGNWTRSHACHILAKVFTFCLCPETGILSSNMTGCFFWQRKFHSNTIFKL